MAAAAKFKKAVEWIEHGKTLVEIGLAVGGGTIVRALLVQYTRLPHMWVTPAWILASAALLGLLLHFIKPKPSAALVPSQTAEAEGVADPSKPQFNTIESFIRSYDNPLLVECERNIQTQANAYQPGRDREQFLIRSYSTLIVVALFEYIWSMIFESQIQALELLNASSHRLDELRPFYDKAASKNPTFYQTYTFASWVGFMRNQVLITEQGEIVNITMRGQEFLKYLIHDRRSAEQRSP